MQSDNNHDQFPKPEKPSRSTIFLLTYTVVLVVALFNARSTMNFLNWVIAILSPFLTGIFIAFILNIITKKLDRYVFKFLDSRKYRFWYKIKRGASVFTAFLLVFLLIVALFRFIIPQIVESINILIRNLPYYGNELQNFTTKIMDDFNLSMDQMVSWIDISAHLASLMTDISGKLFNFAGMLTKFFFNLTMGIIFSIYLLIGKDKILLNMKKILYAFLPNKKVERIYEISHLSSDIFANFVVGQLTEAVILGAMYFIGMSIFKMPYAPLISTFMAIGSLIPIFGPVISSVPSALILLTVNPTMALIFLIMGTIFQQVESNLIYPKIVGDSIGLPGIWVLLSILIGGSLFGGMGMILAVPIASVLYSLTRTAVARRLKNKNMGLEDFDFEITTSQRRKK